MSPKHCCTMIYLTKTGRDQLNRYIDASKRYEQRFKTPLVEGYCLEPFTLVLDGKYIIAFNSNVDVIYNKFKYRRDNDKPYEGAFISNDNDTAGISGDGLIRYLVFSTPERRARFASEVLKYTIPENSDDEIPVQSSQQPEIVFSTSSSIDMEVVGSVVLGITIVGVIALIVVTDGAAAPLLAMI